MIVMMWPVIMIGSSARAESYDHGRRAVVVVILRTRVIIVGVSSGTDTRGDSSVHMSG